MKNLDKILTYSGLTFFIILCIWFILYHCFFKDDLQLSINIAFTLLQSVAIIVGGFWAYFTFGLERKLQKKEEQIINLITAINDHIEHHEKNLIPKYLVNIDKKDDDAYRNYVKGSIDQIVKIKIIIKQSVYLPQKIKTKMKYYMYQYAAIEYYTEDKFKNREEYKKYLIKYWDKTEKEFEQIEQELEDII